MLFSQHRRIGNIVLLSGQVGIKDGKLIEGGLEEETREALRNVSRELNHVGLTMDNVIDVTVFLTDLPRDYAPMNKIYETCFGDPKPTRTCFGVASLPLGAKIEFKVIAEHK